MIRCIATIILVLAIPLQCFAQTVRAKQLSDKGVYDVFTIAEIAFVIRESSIFDTTVEKTSLANLMSPAAAVKSGLPNKLMTELIDRLLQSHHKPYLDVASAFNGGDAGFFWDLKWFLFPSPGGSSGTPYEYHAVVLADGTAVKPELHLCHDYGSYQFEPEKVLFSVLAIDDLLPTTHSEMNEGEIKKVAERSFNEAVSKFKIDEEFRTLAPRRQTFSGKFATRAADDEELEVWAVRFVLSSIENPEDVDYAGSIIVWVTSDLKTSKLTLGNWDTQSIRKPSDAK